MIKRGFILIFLLLALWLILAMPVQATLVYTLENHPDNVGKYAVIAIGADQKPTIAYFDESNDDVIFAKCADPRCRLNTQIRVFDSTASDAGRFMAMEIIPAGGGDVERPILSYQFFNGTNYFARVAVCNDTDCAAPFPFQDVAASDELLATALAIGTDRAPVIAFWVRGEGLRVAKCADSTCSTVSASSLIVSDSNTNVRSLSIAIGQGDQPVITYVRDGELRILQCLQVNNCTSSVVPQNVLSATLNPARSGAVVSASMKSSVRNINGSLLNLPIIAYKYAGDSHNSFERDGMYVIACDDPVCAGDDNTTENVMVAVGSEGDDEVSLAIGPDDNLPYIAHYFGNQNELRFASCKLVDCRGTAPVADLEIVDSDDNVGKFASVAYSTEILQPVVVYYDQSNDNPKVAIVGNDRPRILIGPTLPPPAPAWAVQVRESVGDYANLCIPVQDFDGGPNNPSIEYSWEPINGLVDPSTLTQPPTLTVDAACPGGAETPNDTGALFSWYAGTGELDLDSYALRVVVSDGIDTSSQRLTIQIIETNSKPRINAIPDQVTARDSELRFTFSSTDPDRPINTFTYEIINVVPPVGVVVDPLPPVTASGEFVWTPTQDGRYTFTVQVTDDGTPAETDTRDFVVIVGTALTRNSSFETASANPSIPKAWKLSLLTDDKRVCNPVKFPARSGVCTMFFKSNRSDSVPMIQNVGQGLSSVIVPGDLLYATAAFRARSALKSATVVTINVIYMDGLVEKITLPIAKTTAAQNRYRVVTNTSSPYFVKPLDPVDGKYIRQIKYTIHNPLTAGSFLVDDVNLYHIANNITARGGLFELPEPAGD